MKKKTTVFLSENFQFLEVKFSLHLNRSIFIMDKICFHAKTTKKLFPNTLDLNLTLSENCKTEVAVQVKC